MTGSAFDFVFSAVGIIIFTFGVIFYGGSTNEHDYRNAGMILILGGFMVISGWLGVAEIISWLIFAGFVFAIVWQVTKLFAEMIAKAFHRRK